MPAVAGIERLIRRDRVLMVFGLAAIVVIAWAYLLRESAAMRSMMAEMRMHAAMGMVMPDVRAWGLADWLSLCGMWAVMMVAMMLPSALPVIVLVLGVYRRRGDRRARIAAVAFVGGYLLVWGLFSVAASTAQLALHRLALATPEMRLSSSAVSGVLLLTAGVYQWLPVKSACLTHCQSPFGFLSRHWREGAFGGLGLGVRHGFFCVGCCWLVMSVLFVVGVMNLIWIAALSAFVLLEKLTSRGAWLGRVAGAAAAAWGLSLLVAH